MIRLFMPLSFMLQVQLQIRMKLTVLMLLLKINIATDPKSATASVLRNTASNSIHVSIAHAPMMIPCKIDLRRCCSLLC